MTINVHIRDTKPELWSLALLAVGNVVDFSPNKGSTTLTYYGKYKVKVLKSNNTYSVFVTEIKDTSWKEVNK